MFALILMLRGSKFAVIYACAYVLINVETSSYWEFIFPKWLSLCERPFLSVGLSCEASCVHYSAVFLGVPDFNCDHCKCIGHHVGNCKRRKELIQKEKPKNSEPAKVYIPVQQKDKEKVPETVVLEGNEKDTEIVDLDNSIPLAYAQVNHEQLRRETDKELEQELNIVTNREKSLAFHSSPIQNERYVNEVEVNSETSEFVDATQSQRTPNVVDLTHETTRLQLAEQDAHIVTEHISPIVQKEIRFLKESWDNLAEQEEHLNLNSPEFGHSKAMTNSPDVNDMA
ncbi:hypothetical protein TSUD_409580 [Trifolium subterraneum]|uniref:Uncharacterized protein n=1 Tax=Trifolium subterraneum TaxID=3900 RepID=A0A2Z6P1V4_TRISU|nr:hypothetical protein TSUD_409580 [Trifolium subterraneum]